MSKQTIWNYLKTHTALSDEAIAGIMGNMEAESNCESCRLQGDFSPDRSSSKAYAAAINNGTKSIESAAQDQLGFGLCQWTFPQRKVNCFNACRSYGVGIENESAQLAFMLAEMQMEFTNMWNRLLITHDIGEAAGLMCREYERPAVLNITDRTRFGQKIYAQFHGKDITPEPEPEPSPSPVPSDDRTDKIIALLEQIIALLK